MVVQMAKKTIHVVPSPAGGWNVKRGGAERASKHFERQSQAVDYARKTSKDERGELYIHRRDGTIRDKDSHSNDPHPPRG